MRSGLWTTAAVLFLAGASSAAAEIQISEAWLRAAPPGAPMDGYVRIVNAGDSDDVLLGVRSNDVDAAYLAQTRFVDGAYRAEPLAPILAPAGGEIRLVGRDGHIRLEGLERRLHLGATQPIYLEFEKAGEVAVVFVALDGPSGALGLSVTTSGGEATEQTEDPPGHDMLDTESGDDVSAAHSTTGH